MKTTWKVAVETGSCSHDYKRWEEQAHCGHVHKSIQTAQQCLEKLTRRYCQHNHIAGTLCRRCYGMAASDYCSAAWYSARIHDQDNQRVCRGD